MERKYTFADIIGRSPAMQRLFDILPDIAQTESTVLIEGESGTGKELFARAIHDLSHRKAAKFVAINSPIRCWNQSSSATKPVLSRTRAGTNRASF